MIIQMGPPEEVCQLPVSFQPDRFENLGERRKLPTNLGLYASFHNINWKKQEPQHGTQQPPTDEVIHQMSTASGGSREMLLYGAAEAEEEHIAEPVPEENGHQSSVILPNPVAPQGPEGLVSVCEFVMVLVVLQQCLNSFQRSENGFCRPCKHSRRAAGGELWSTDMPVQEAGQVLVEPEHQCQGGGLLHQRGQDPAVQVAEPIPPQLQHRGPRSEPVQLLPEQDLLNGEGDGHVAEGRAAAAQVMLQLAHASKARRQVLLRRR